jgi:hypothetical protein
MSNCGNYGVVCNPSLYNSCSWGVCSSAARVLLPGATSPAGWGGTASMDDGFLGITVPFPIRLYGTTTSTPSIQSNGVSHDAFTYYILVAIGFVRNFKKVGSFNHER